MEPVGWERPTRRPLGRPAPVVLAVLLGVLVIAVASSGAPDGSGTAVEGGRSISIERDVSRPRATTRAGPPPPVTTDAWTVLPDAPVGSRIGHELVTFGDRIVMWGGLQRNSPLRTGAVLDATTLGWDRLPDAPVVDAGHRGVATTFGVAFVHPVTPVHIDLRSMRWRELPEPLAGREDDLTLLPVVTSWSGRAVVATARDDGTAGPLLALEDAPSAPGWTEIPAPDGPVSSDHALAAEPGGIVLVGPGRAEEFARQWVEAEQRWEPIAPPPDVDADVLASARVTARASALGTVVVIEDRTPERGATLVLALDAAGQWRRYPDLPLDPDRVRPEVVAGNEMVAVVAGSRAGGVVLYLRTAIWTPVPAMPLDEPRLRRAAVAADRLVQWGGTGGDGVVMALGPAPGR